MVLCFGSVDCAGVGVLVVRTAANSALPANRRPDILTVVVLSRECRIMAFYIICEPHTVCQILFFRGVQ